jgi:hypothetical protein
VTLSLRTFVSAIRDLPVPAVNLFTSEKTSVIVCRSQTGDDKAPAAICHHKETSMAATVRQILTG